MHNSVGKNQDITNVVQKFKSMEDQIKSISTNLDERAIQGLIEKSTRLISLFE
jgi:hypothetical protein